MANTTQQTGQPRKTGFRLGPFLLTFVLMQAAWQSLSGLFDPFHQTLGVISSLIVAWFSDDLLFPPGSRMAPAVWGRFVLYIPWLIWEIVKANMWLLYLVFHPRMMDKIDPRIIKFKGGIDGQMARLTFANSITLTPGTITVYVDVDGEYTVHAIDGKSASGLPGAMRDKVAKTFGER